MKLLYGMDEMVAKWVEERVPSTKFSKGAKAIGFVHNYVLVAGAVFTEYREEYRDVAFSFAGEGQWANRQAMAAVFHYAFGTLKCRRVTAYVKKGNRRPVRMLTRHLNFRYEGCIRDMFPDGKGALIFGLLRRDIPAWVSRYYVT